MEYAFLYILQRFYFIKFINMKVYLNLIWIFIYLLLDLFLYLFIILYINI